MTANFCPDCGEDLQQYGVPAFCPGCGAEVQGLYGGTGGSETSINDEIDAPQEGTQAEGSALDQAIENAQDLRPPAEDATEVVRRHGHLLEEMAERDDKYGAIAEAFLEVADNHSYDGGQL